VDSGNFQLETYRGTVFDDANDSHAFQQGDPVLANVPIFVDGAQAATTDANGNYSVLLTAGGHTISEGIPSGYIAIAPASGSLSITANQSGGTVTGTDFADALPAASLDDSQAGYNNVPSSSWTNLAQGWMGESQIHAATVNQKIFASWNVGSSEAVAQYEVFVTYVPAPNRGQVYFTLYDGVEDNAHRLGQVLVDQTVTPDVSGNQNGTTSDGTVWLSLGKYDITQGNLIVVMTGANGGKKTIDADGVLYIPAGQAQAPQPLKHAAVEKVLSQQTLQPLVSVATLPLASPAENSREVIAALLATRPSLQPMPTQPASVMKATSANMPWAGALVPPDRMSYKDAVEQIFTAAAKRTKAGQGEWADSLGAIWQPDAIGLG
jgi:hypothetical protein